MAGASPRGWVVSTVAASLVLAALDTLGVAAMIPLTQLIAGAPPDSGALGVIADIVGTTSPPILIPLVATSSQCCSSSRAWRRSCFRWWLLGRTTRVSALVVAELMRRYVLAPYAHHRSRRLSEIYRNITRATNAGHVRAAGGRSACARTCSCSSAIVIVLAIASPVVTLLTVVFFGVFVFGLQRMLRATADRTWVRRSPTASLQAWQFLMPALDGFREATTHLERIECSSTASARARLREARAGRRDGHPLRAPALLAGDRASSSPSSASRSTCSRTGTPGACVHGARRVRRRRTARAADAEPRLDQRSATIRTGRRRAGHRARTP